MAQAANRTLSLRNYQLTLLDALGTTWKKEDI
jgi:hypothetical protein